MSHPSAKVNKIEFSHVNAENRASLMSVKRKINFKLGKLDEMMSINAYYLNNQKATKSVILEVAFGAFSMCKESDYTNSVGQEIEDN